jgi:NADPH-dependent curcumin reductase CurA
VWDHLSSDWKPQHLERIATREVTLEQLPEVFSRMLAGESFGRTLVRVGAVA